MTTISSTPNQYEYSVRMQRPDRKRAVNRPLFADQPITTASLLQLAGFLTHKLFGNHERGGAGTFYTVTVKENGRVVNVYTVRRTEDGTYVPVGA